MKNKKQADLRTPACYPGGRSEHPPGQLPSAIRAAFGRYLISLGADREAANDDGELPADLIDPDFKDLVELFKGTKMD